MGFPQKNVELAGEFKAACQKIASLRADESASPLVVLGPDDDKTCPAFQNGRFRSGLLELPRDSYNSSGAFRLMSLLLTNHNSPIHARRRK